MTGMTPQALLAFLGKNGVQAALELQQEREDMLREREESRQLRPASRAALKDAAGLGRTIEGRKTFQTILTSHAYDMDGGLSTVPDYRRVQIIGVHPAVFSAARQRAKSVQPALHPAAGLDLEAYWHRPRARRSDATPPDLIKLMRQF